MNVLFAYENRLWPHFHTTGNENENYNLHKTNKIFPHPQRNLKLMPQLDGDQQQTWSLRFGTTQAVKLVWDKIVKLLIWYLVGRI